MSKFDVLLPGILGQWYRQISLWHHFKFVLPKIESTIIEGIHLDLRPFTPKVRNRILMGYEEAERRMCREILTKDDSVLEIGGGIGFIGLFCQKRIGIQHYVTVEANPATIAILNKNYSLNDLAPVIWNFALGKDNSTVELNTGGDFWEHFVVRSSPRIQADHMRVPAMSLESLLRKTDELVPNRPPVNALIIDVEGAERCIDFHQLPERINKIVIELHPKIIGRRNVAQILEVLGQRQFRVIREMEDSFALMKN